MEDEPWPDSPCGCPKLTVDVVVFTLRDRQLQVLLVRRDRWPCEGMWEFPGGLVGVDDALEDAATRRLTEKTGLSGLFLEQLYTYGEPQRDPRYRVITVAYLAIVSPSAMAPRAARQSKPVRWWSISQLPALAFDYERILAYALTRLRSGLENTAIGFELLAEEFTLSELQAAHEIVLGEALDRRNFRRKILEAGVIEASGQYRGGEGRPARLYHCREDAVAQVKARRPVP